MLISRPLLAFSAQSKPVKSLPQDASLVVGDEARPFTNAIALQAGETEAQKKIVHQSPTKRFTYQTIHTTRGRDGQPAKPLPHDYYHLTEKSNTAGVLAVIYKDSKGVPRLMTHLEYRPSVGRPVLWLPGGGIEKGESPAKAIIREGKEESLGFNPVNPVVFTSFPVPENSPYTDLGLYMGVVLANLPEKGLDQREKSEKDVINNTQRELDPPLSTLLDPKAWREFCHKHQQKIIDSGGKEGFLVGHPFMFLSSLLGDQMKKLLNEHGHKLIPLKKDTIV